MGRGSLTKVSIYSNLQESSWSAAALCCKILQRLTLRFSSSWN
jgi:hypothetical protein